MRCAWFEINTTSVPVDGSASDTLLLTRLPVGCRVIGGQVSWGAMAGGATAKIGSGLYNDAAGTATVVNDDLYLTSTVLTNAGTAAIATADVDPGLMGQVITAAAPDVILSAGVAAYAAAKVLQGYILYVVD